MQCNVKQTKSLRLKHWITIKRNVANLTEDYKLSTYVLSTITIIHLRECISYLRLSYIKNVNLIKIILIEREKLFSIVSIEKKTNLKKVPLAEFLFHQDIPKDLLNKLLRNKIISPENKNKNCNEPFRT